MKKRWIFTLLAILSVIIYTVAQSVQFTDTVYHADKGTDIKSIINYQVHSK